MLADYTFEESSSIVKDWGEAIIHNDVYGFGLSRSAAIYPFSGTYTYPYTFKGFFDNDDRLYGEQVFFGYDVLPPEQVLGKKIVIFPQYAAYKAIREQLKSYGLREGRDFISAQDFWMLVGYYKFDELFCGGIFSNFVGMRCNLNCIGCTRRMNTFHDCQERDVREIMKENDDFLNRIDRLWLVNIVGGEPFLYPSLNGLLENLLAGYGNKIDMVYISTNGTIIPDKDFLEVYRTFSKKILVNISDYNCAGINGYTERFVQTTAFLQENGIRHSFQSVQWYEPDLTMEEMRQLAAYDSAQMRKQYKSCECRKGFALSGNRLFPCTRARDGEIRGGLTDRGTVKLNAMDRFALLLHFLSYIPQGFMDYCRECSAAGTEFARPIPSAQQLDTGSSSE